MTKLNLEATRRLKRTLTLTPRQWMLLRCAISDASNYSAKFNPHKDYNLTAAFDEQTKNQFFNELQSF